MALCLLCGKSPITVNNISKSARKNQKKVSRKVRPNLQKGICTRCVRTIKKYQTAVK